MILRRAVRKSDIWDNKFCMSKKSILYINCHTSLACYPECTKLERCHYPYFILGSMLVTSYAQDPGIFEHYDLETFCLGDLFRNLYSMGIYYNLFLGSRR